VRILRAHHLEARGVEVGEVLAEGHFGRVEEGSNC
jgi:hypothetical protein